VNGSQSVEFDIFAMLSEAFDIFKKMFPIMMLMYLVFFLVSSLVAIGLGADREKPNTFSFLLNVAVLFILTAFLSGVYTASVWSYMNQHENPFKQGFSRCIEVFPRLFGALLLVLVFVIGGLVFFIVPGIMIALALALVTPVLVIENPGISASLKRSYELTDGYKVKLFFLLIIIIIALIIPIALIAAIFGDQQLEAVTQVLSSVATIFNTILYVVVYKHLSAE